MYLHCYLLAIFVFKGSNSAETRLLLQMPWSQEKLCDVVCLLFWSWRRHLPIRLLLSVFIHQVTKLSRGPRKEELWLCTTRSVMPERGKYFFQSLKLGRGPIQRFETFSSGIWLVNEIHFTTLATKETRCVNNNESRKFRELWYKTESCIYDGTSSPWRNTIILRLSG